MKDLYDYLARLCGITRNCEFRFVGNAALLQSDTMWAWYGLVCDLINYARADDEDVRLIVKLMQPPCLFSVSVSADNDSLNKHLDEYPAEILTKLGKLDIANGRVYTYKKEDGGSGITIDAPEGYAPES